MLTSLPETLSKGKQATETPRWQEKPKICVRSYELNAAPPMYCLPYQKRKIHPCRVMYFSVLCLAVQLRTEVLRRTKGELRDSVCSKEKSKLLFTQWLARSFEEGKTLFSPTALHCLSQCLSMRFKSLEMGFKLLEKNPKMQTIIWRKKELNTCACNIHDTHSLRCDSCIKSTDQKNWNVKGTSKQVLAQAHLHRKVILFIIKWYFRSLVFH